MFKIFTTGTALLFISSLVYAQNTFPSNGNIGIGTNSPTNALDISIPDAGNTVNRGLIIRRNAGFLRLGNGTSNSSVFVPAISGKSSLINTPGLYITGEPLEEGTASPGIILRGSMESSQLVSSPVLKVQNYQTDLFTIEPTGLSRFHNRLFIGLRNNAVNHSHEYAGLNISTRSNTNIQLAESSWGNSHAILFNAYMSASQLNYSLAAPGNTKYVHNVGDHASGAAGIFFIANGGVIDFKVSHASSGANTDVIWNEFPEMRINRSGLVGIGTTKNVPGYKLAVGGKALFEEVTVSLQGQWPDYVFEETYPLKSLTEVEQYIQSEKHLPGVPSAAEVGEKGIDVGEMNALLLKKIEELTLYLITQQKELEEVKQQVQDLIKSK